MRKYTLLGKYITEQEKDHIIVKKFYRSTSIIILNLYALNNIVSKIQSKKLTVTR